MSARNSLLARGRLAGLKKGHQPVDNKEANVSEKKIYF